MSCFATLLDFHIPTNQEMEVSPGGNIHFRNFQNNHFTQNASHLAKAFGFDESTLPHHNAMMFGAISLRESEISTSSSQLLGKYY